GALRLIVEPAPGDLHRHRPQAAIPGLADALLVVAVTALIGRRCQARQRTQLLAIANPTPAKKLHDVQPSTVDPNAPQIEELANLGHRLLVRGADLPGPLILQILDLSVHELPTF